MTSEQIKPLLEKYWAGDTSLEEELALKTFFSGNAVPEELKRYQPLFIWKTKQLQLKGTAKLKTGIKKPVSFQWYSFLKIAASILLVLTLGIGFYTHYQQEKQMDKIFSETYSNPEDALQETKDVIGIISSALNLAKDKQDESQKVDSLEQTPKNNTVE
jgi:predicted DNA-binding protein YlxM (UPF0122 family)